jgi:TonB family protein
MKQFSFAFVSVCALCIPMLGQDKPPSLTDAGPIVGAQKAGANTAGTASPETKIQGLIRAADQAAKNRDYSTCAQMLEQVVAIDPNVKNGWNYLGWTYNALGQYGKAEAALRKAIALNPADTQAYNNLGQALAYQRKYDEAIPQYVKQIELRPKDPWAHSNLGRMYLLTKQYQKAISELEIAAVITPDDASIPFNMGRAWVKLNESEKATKAFEKSAELQPVPLRWNDVAYEMAAAKLDLAKAEQYAQYAIAASVQQMRDTSLDHLTKEDAYQAARIASYWDTAGWVRFQRGDLKEAEKYVKSAWMVRVIGVISDHLGQIYERQERKAEAIQMYEMALASNAPPAETRDRLMTLAGADAEIEVMTEQGRQLLKESRTISIKNSHHAEGFAEFWILLSPGPIVRGVKFANGDDELKSFEKDLQAVAYPDSFPEATEIRLLRRGRLSCTNSTPDCRLLMVSSQSVPTEELQSTTPSVAGSVGRVTQSVAVAGARLIKRVQPFYPLEARQYKVQGVVKLHAIIGTDGSITQLQVVSGHPMLVDEAMHAFRQWKYQPTLVDGKPVEVDTEIDVIFQLNN